MPTSRSARGTPRSNACTSSMAPVPLPRAIGQGDRKSTRLNSSHTEIYTLSLHDALPIFLMCDAHIEKRAWDPALECLHKLDGSGTLAPGDRAGRSEEHTSELQSHRDLHSFPTRRSSDLPDVRCPHREARVGPRARMPAQARWLRYPCPGRSGR